MAGTETNLSGADYTVAAIIMAVPVAIGVGYAFKDAKNATRAEYLLGGRQMSILPVALSLFVTFTSSISLMGTPADTFYFGVSRALLPTGVILSYVIGYFTILPLMYPLRITSIFQYIKLRYKSESVRVLSTTISLLITVLYMSLCILSPALALQAVANVPLWMSIIVLGILGTIYTAIGGIKSVIWTDAFQTLVLFVGLIVIIVKGCFEVGGLSHVFSVGVEDGRLDYNKLSPDPRLRHTVWSLTFGIVFGNIVTVFNQATLQRISCMKSLRDAKIMFGLQGIFVTVSDVILALLGLIIYAYYKLKQCDPLKAGQIGNANQLAPYFVLDTMGSLPGMTGLFISILCCGSLSTLSSGINSLAANTVEDILHKPLRSLKESTITTVTKFTALLYGCLIVTLTYLATAMDGPITQMAGTVFGALGSPIAGVFLMGGAVPWANKYGAASGIFASIAYNLWISVGAKLQGTLFPFLSSPGTHGCSSNPTAQEILNITTTAKPILEEANLVLDNSDRFFMWDITYEWYGLMGLFVCVSVGLLVSFLTNRFVGQSNEEWKSTEPRYIFPFLVRCWSMEEHEKNKTDTAIHTFTNGETMDLVNEIRSNVPEKL